MATKKSPPPPSAATDLISPRIVLIRGQKVLLDSDLAELYGVETRALVQAIKRNLERFPQDFMFQLGAEELANLRSQTVISSWGGRRYAPFAFTEQGVAMLSSVLRSPQAIAVNVEIMRAFVRLRQVLAANDELAARLAELESKTELLALRHDNLADNTRAQLKQVFEAIRQLMAPPTPPQKKPIGFHVRERSAAYRVRKKRGRA
jgi:hypothetical protein